MPLTRTVPLLLSVLVGSLLGLVTWGFLRIQRHTDDENLMETRDEVFFGLLAFAVFSLGAFVTYILLMVCGR
jgi:hypothetical protein